MHYKYLKNTAIAFIILIVLLGLLLFNTSRKLTKTKMENIAQKEQISTVNTELKNLRETLGFFYFNKIEIRATSMNSVIAIGDTLEVDIGIFALNLLKDNESGEYIEPTIVVATYDDSEKEMIGTYDTIPAKQWMGSLKKIATKPGTYKIIGRYQFPDNYGFKGNFPFYFEYTVVE